MFWFPGVLNGVFESCPHPELEKELSIFSLSPPATMTSPWKHNGITWGAFKSTHGHEAFPRGFPTGLSHVPPWCESILGLKVKAVQGKQISLEWTETSGALREWWHDPGDPLAFPAERASS